jgi:hypothetical protein
MLFRCLLDHIKMPPVNAMNLSRLVVRPEDIQMTLLNSAYVLYALTYMNLMIFLFVLYRLSVLEVSDHFVKWTANSRPYWHSKAFCF